MDGKIKKVIKIEQKYITEKRAFVKISGSLALAGFCKEIIGNNASEALLVMCLNTKNEVIAYTELFRGSLNLSIAHPREVFQFAIINNSARIAISHNHPSGHTEPSENDVRFTRNIREAGELIGIELLDHIIVSDLGDYYSFREKEYN